MITDPKELARRWEDSAGQVAAVLQAGEDACFLTLGDPLLYSTYIYLLRALRKILPEAQAVTVPGVTAFSAAAALTDFPIGEAKDLVTIVPTADDLQALEAALDRGGTVVLMKIGKRLGAILDLLEKKKLTDQAVFVSRVGHPEQRLETDLRKLRAEGPEAGYLSIILVHGGKGKFETRNPKSETSTNDQNPKVQNKSF
jgi:precorrin-2/cobalt-factor-2 C20-methyltransferase